MPGPLRIVIVDDHEMVLESLAAYIDAQPDLEVAVALDSVAAFREAVGAIAADLVVTDWHLKDGTGADVASASRDVMPNRPVLVISGLPDDQIIRQAIDASCSGFVSKGSSVAELAGVMRAVAAGAAVFPAEWVGRIGKTETPGHDALTDRELEVLRCLADAQTVEEIADGLFLSVHTVRNHVRAIRTKLQARSQLEAVVVAARSGLLSVG